MIFIINLNYILSEDDKCTKIDKCLKCKKEDKCDKCESGYVLSVDKTKCEKKEKTNSNKKKKSIKKQTKKV